VIFSNGLPTAYHFAPLRVYDFALNSSYATGEIHTEVTGSAGRRATAGAGESLFSKLINFTKANK
jgi:hypothetical protein